MYNIVKSIRRMKERKISNNRHEAHVLLLESAKFYSQITSKIVVESGHRPFQSDLQRMESEVKSSWKRGQRLNIAVDDPSTGGGWDNGIPSIIYCPGQDFSGAVYKRS